jgi:hypothetical protein
MKKDVFNRALFEKKYKATQDTSARDTLRSMGGVAPKKPSQGGGILASSPELMMAALGSGSMGPAPRPPAPGNMMASEAMMASPARQVAPPPAPAPGLPPMGVPTIPAAPTTQVVQPSKPVRPAPQPKPVQKGTIRMAEGGPIDIQRSPFEKQSAVNKTYSRQSEIPEEAAAVIPDADQLTELTLKMEKAALDPAGFAKDIIDSELPPELQTGDAEQDLKTIAKRYNIDTSKVEKEKEEAAKDPEKALRGPADRVDELNRAIAKAKLAGSLSGGYVNPTTMQKVGNSMSERISAAVVDSLAIMRDTESGREKAMDALMKARLEAMKDAPGLYSDKTKTTKTQYFGEVSQYEPTANAVLNGVTPMVVDPTKITTEYGRMYRENQQLVDYTNEALALLENESVAGLGGALARSAEGLAQALPETVREGLGINDLSGASEFDVIQRVLAAQMAPMLLGESGRTISDGDRARVASILGIAYENTEGTVGGSVGGITRVAFTNEKQLAEALRRVQEILGRNHQSVQDEYFMLMGKVPNSKVSQPQQQQEQVIELDNYEEYM